MADLSKIKLNGVEYNLKDTVARNAVAPPLATHTTNGLMSALDKQTLDNLNPNVTVSMNNIAMEQIYLINAKQDNILNFEGIIEPQIGAQIRTSNLLNVEANTPGYYIGSNGSLSTNANDRVGDFISVSPGQNIYYTGTIGPTSSSSINRRLHVYDANQNWIKQLNFAGNLKVGNNWSTNGTIPSNGAYVRVSWGVEDINVMISIGAPTKYEPYYLTPFAPLESISINISSDNTVEHTTTYTENIPTIANDVYSLKFNPIEGKIWATSNHISSYNNETITTQWWSDRDIYVEGTSPTIGAEVIYLLDEEDYIEYNVTSITIPLNYQTNYIWINNGLITALTYYAETLAVHNITIYDGVSFGDTNIVEQNVINWNNAAELIDTKADIDSPEFIGSPKLALTPGRSDVSLRLASASFVQNLWNNVAFVETTNKASQNYEIGDYVYVLGTLYKVIATITRGNSFVTGTNIQATTVMNEIKAILNQ